MTQVTTVEQPHAHEMQLACRYPADEIVKMLDSDAQQGLTAARVEQHLQRYGANALRESREMMGLFATRMGKIFCPFCSWVPQKQSDRKALQFLS